MEKESGMFSKNARKLMSRAWSLGIDPRIDARDAVRNKGKEIVTRGDLKILKDAVGQILSEKPNSRPL